MKTGRRGAFAGLAGVLLTAFASPAAASPPSAPRPPAGATPAALTGGLLPLAFEPNMGQSEAHVRFVSRAAGHAVLLTATGPVFVLAAGREGGVPPSQLRMNLSGGDPAAVLEGLDPLPGVSNYLIGADPGSWRTGIPTYSRVAYRGVWPGTDVVFHRDAGGTGLEYDIVVGPGADPARVGMSFEGMRRLSVDSAGALRIETPAGTVTHGRPAVHQTVGSARHPVEASYEIRGDGVVGFRLGVHDPRLPLVIDPVVAYEDVIGGHGGEEGTAVTVDGQGSAYVTGGTASTDFPVVSGAAQSRHGGATCQLPPGTLPPNCGITAFVAKLGPGGALVYSTYLGGSVFDEGRGIAVDSGGGAFVTGLTGSPNFPTTPTALQSLYSSGGYDGLAEDAFVSRLDSSGARLLYSTYLGGTGTPMSNPGLFTTGGYDFGNAIAVDDSGHAYVTGKTDSGNFPVTPTAYQPFLNGVPVAGATQASPGCLRLNFACYDAFVTEIDTNAIGPASLAYSTFFGGGNDDEGDGLSLGPGGTVYIAGTSSSTDLHVTTGAFQPGPDPDSTESAFVAVLRPAPLGGLSLDRSKQLVYSTYLGGPGFTEGRGIATDTHGRAHVTGSTELSQGRFPTASAAQSGPGACPAGGDCQDAFVASIDIGSSGAAALIYSTYLGGAGTDEGMAIAADAAGDACVTGGTSSTDFPTVNAVQGSLTVVNDNRSASNPFVTCYSPSGTYLLSTYLAFGGGGGEGIALDGGGGILVTGSAIRETQTIPPLRSAVLVVRLSGGPIPAPARFSGDASAVRFDAVTLFGGQTGGEGPTGLIARRGVAGGLGLCEAGPAEGASVSAAGAGACTTVAPMPGNPLVGVAAATESVQSQGTPFAGSVVSSSAASSITLLPGIAPPPELGLPPSTVILRATELAASSAASCAGGRASARGSSSVASLVIAGQTVATQPVGQRIVFDPTGHHRVTLYGNPISVNPTGSRVPLAVVVLNYSRYDPNSNSQVTSPVEVEFPQGGPLSSIITGRVFLAYAQAGIERCR